MGSLEALALLAKEPSPGRVKTRLCPPLSPDEAARLGSCLLEDAAEELASLRGVLRLLFLDPPESVARVAGGPFAGFERLPQRGGDLGERMLRAASLCFRRGARRAVLVGADCPGLTTGRVRQAFRELRSGAAAVLGPSADGGYYLLGLTFPDARLFEGIPWSTDAVLRETAARCRAAGAPFSCLRRERDVDTFGDLLALRDRVASHPTPRCPRTREFLTSFFPSKEARSPSRRG
jgi:rSAM/selenodomain-associated transferase 1